MSDTNEQRDPVKEARELLNAPNYILILPEHRKLMGGLCDEIDRLNKQLTPRTNELNEIHECEKCDLCEDHHA